jgi:CheY-like chemotaxis protein
MFGDLSYLYVEDDPLSREGLELVLRRVMGFQNVSIFEDSTNFIARVKLLPQRPDVYLLDIHMRPHTGFEMLAMLRADPAFTGCKVIALTASVMSEEVHTLRTSGFDGIISKPIDVTTFPQLLERALQGEPVWTISS